MSAIDLTAKLNTEDIKKKFKEMYSAASESFEGIARDSKKVDSALDGISKAASDASEDLSENISIQKAVIKSLEEQYKEAQKIFEKAAPGIQKQTLGNELASIKRELDGEKQGLVELEAAQEKYKASMVSLRSQIAHVRDEMGRLELAGKKNTQEYRQQETELKRLGTAYRKVQAEQKALTTGGTQWAGIISGVQGLTGAYTAAQGVMSLFVSDNERLMRIQTKLQALMSILIGLQQTANTLHEASAFRLTTMRKATELWNVVNAKTSAGLQVLGLSAKAANIATKALYGTITLGLSVAVGAAISWYSKWSEKQEEVKKKQDELKKTVEEFNKAVGENAGKAIASFKTLQEQWNALGSSMTAKKKFIKDNADAFDDLGVSVTSVADAENLFVKNEQVFIESLKNRALAIAAMGVAAQTAGKVVSNNMELAERKSRQANNAIAIQKLEEYINEHTEEVKLPNGQSYRRSKKGEAGSVHERYKLLSQIKEIDKENNKAINELESSNKIYEDQLDKAVRLNVKNTQETSDALKSIGLSTPEQRKAAEEAQKEQDKKSKVTLEAQNKLSAAILANDLALQKSRVDILKDGREKRLAGIDLENRQTIEKIEKERLEAIEAAKKGGGTLSKEENSKFDARIDNANIYAKNQVDSINKEYADDLEDTYRKITSVFLSEEEKKRAGIKKTYDDWRKEAQESLEAGNITQQQYDDLMGYLGQAEDFESIKNALDEFETFQEKKVRIAKEYDDKIADIQKRNTEGQFDANIKEAERQKKEAIYAINKEVADREGVFSDWADSILNMGLRMLEAKKEYFENILATQGGSLSGEERAMLEAKITALEKQIEVAKRNKKTGKQSIENWKDTATAMNAVAESARSIIENIDGIDEGFKNAISDVVDFSDGMGQMANAVAGIKESLNNKDTLGAITGIAGAVSLGIGLVTKLFSLFKRKDYMAEFRKEVEKLNRELARTKLQASLDDDGSQTIFGDNTWENAKKNVNALNVALQTYNKTLGSIADRKQYSGLFAILADFRGIKSTFDNASESIANMQVKIRHSTWFRSAKYTSLKDAVPELFNDDGSVNMDALEKFIGTDTFKKLSDENQQYLQNMSEDWKVYQDALEKVKDYLSGIFGDLGNTMTDALVDAFASGTDAAEAFADSVSEMLEKLGKQMIYSVTLAPVMDKAQEKMMEIMKNEGLSDQSKFNSYVSILDQLIGDVEEQQGAFNSLLEQYQNIASGKGFDIFTPDSSTSQEASSGEFQTLSQDTGKELNGRFTAIQEYTANIRDDVRLILAQNGQKLNEMTNIRDIAIQLNGNVAIIKGHTSHLEEMDDKLGRMVKIMNEKL